MATTMELISSDNKIHDLFETLESQKSLVSKCTDLYDTLTSHFNSLQNSIDSKALTLESKLNSLDSNLQTSLNNLEKRESSIPERLVSLSSEIESKKQSAIDEYGRKIDKTSSLSGLLRSLCRRMDHEGLVRVLVERRREKIPLWNEMSGALKECVDPARMVLETVKEFVDAKETADRMADKRWACGVVVSGLFRPEELKNKSGFLFSRKTVAEAEEVVRRWREKAEKVVGGSGGGDGGDGDGDVDGDGNDNGSKGNDGGDDGDGNDGNKGNDGGNGDGNDGNEGNDGGDGDGDGNVNGNKGNDGGDGNGNKGGDGDGDGNDGNKGNDGDGDGDADGDGDGDGHGDGNKGNDGGGGSRMGSAEVAMFLQVVVGFGLTDIFEVEFYKKIVMEFIASRDDMAKLACITLGDRLPDFIDQLIKNGKEVEAVYFASESGLTDRFKPALLLQAGFDRCKKNAAEMSKKGGNGIDEAINYEMKYIKSIIKCVENNKLQSQYPVNSLWRQLSKLGKIKSDKKKGIEPSKSSIKRSRSSRRPPRRSSEHPPRSGKRPKYPSHSRRENVPRAVSPVSKYLGTYTYGASLGTSADQTATPTPTPSAYGGYDYGANTTTTTTYEPPTYAP